MVSATQKTTALELPMPLEYAMEIALLMLMEMVYAMITVMTPVMEMLMLAACVTVQALSMSVVVLICPKELATVLVTHLTKMATARTAFRIPMETVCMMISVVLV
jgi:hypothetical protein